MYCPLEYLTKPANERSLWLAAKSMGWFPATNFLNALWCKSWNCISVRNVDLVHELCCHCTCMKWDNGSWRKTSSVQWSISVMFILTQHSLIRNSLNSLKVIPRSELLAYSLKIEYNYIICIVIVIHCIMKGCRYCVPYIGVFDIIQHVEHEDKATEIKRQSTWWVDLVLMCLLHCKMMTKNKL